MALGVSAHARGLRAGGHQPFQSKCFLLAGVTRDRKDGSAYAPSRNRPTCAPPAGSPQVEAPLGRDKIDGIGATRRPILDYAETLARLHGFNGFRFSAG